MRILPLTLLVLLVVSARNYREDDSPHGDDFSIGCEVCHSTRGWKLDPEIYSFDHNTTAMPLTGQHRSVDCKLCHPSLVFSEAGENCSDCHTDMHYQTVGPDCSRCHNTYSWIVNNITEIHRMGRFPLIGPHLMAECSDCHPSASLLRFEPLRSECYDCHQQDYISATNPNHVQGNMSTECTQCHSMHALSWSGSGFNHLFFPLTDGHATADCSLCHRGSDYSDVSPECFSCHEPDFLATTNPNHPAAGISTSCQECHTIRPGWEPAVFPVHDQFFPLTMAHSSLECAECHVDGNYSNTSPECYACHQEDYNQSTNPNHAAAAISTFCEECHTSNPGWEPAVFPTHDQVFALTLGHSDIECIACHINGDFTNTSSECSACHLEDYNQSTNPNHVSAGLPMDCAQCHTTLPGWKPADFPVHDAQFFPINSGKHREQWSDCSDCHTSSSSWSVFSCIDCHEHNRTDMDDKHSETPDYQYNSLACLDCHPQGVNQ